MHCSRVVEPDAGKPRRGARRAARALPPTNGEQATARATHQSRPRRGRAFDADDAYDFEGFQGSYASLYATPDCTSSFPGLWSTIKRPRK